MPKKVYTGEIFERFKNNNFYFADKTRMISKLIDKNHGIYLIIRPRRFGKSLNLSMIKGFFKKPTNVNDKRENLFDGLEVSKNRKKMRHFHKYPVIYLKMMNLQIMNLP